MITLSAQATTSSELCWGFEARYETGRRLGEPWTVTPPAARDARRPNGMACPTLDDDVNAGFVGLCSPGLQSWVLSVTPIN